MSGIVLDLEDKSSESRWEGRSRRQEEGKCQSLVLIKTMVDLALVCFLAGTGNGNVSIDRYFASVFLDYVLRFRRGGDNAHTIGSIMILNLGI